MKIEFKLSESRLFRLIVEGLLSTLVLFFSIFTAAFAIAGGIIIPVYLAMGCLFSSLVYLFRLLFIKEKTCLIYIKFIGIAIGYLAMMTLAFFMKDENETLLRIFANLFFGLILFNVTIDLIISHRIRDIVFAGLKVVFAVLFIILYSTNAMVEEGIKYAVGFGFVPLFMAILAFIHALFMMFSGVKKKTLITVIRKTYAIEILYGLVVLIVATSLVLIIVEPDMVFADALWYCFAIVTTIGFGDVTATTIIGRVLSVILGIYGIVVVALITSIIVNLYNETKDEKKTIVVTKTTDAENKEVIKVEETIETVKPEEPEKPEE